MAFPVVWSPEAVEDIEAIAAYIERNSPWYAKAVVSTLVEVADRLPEFPELGRAVPEIGNASIRERLVHRYRLIYRIGPDRILIAAVIHGRQDFAPFVARIGDSQP
jgi:plasmid stabilization system protein ParE